MRGIGQSQQQWLPIAPFVFVRLFMQGDSLVAGRLHQGISLCRVLLRLTWRSLAPWLLILILSCALRRPFWWRLKSFAQVRRARDRLLGRPVVLCDWACGK